MVIVELLVSRLVDELMIDSDHNVDGNTLVIIVAFHVTGYDDQQDATGSLSQHPKFESRLVWICNSDHRLPGLMLRSWQRLRCSAVHRGPRMVSRVHWIGHPPIGSEGPNTP